MVSGRCLTPCRTTWASASRQRVVARCAGNGPSSPYASFFDIDWKPIKADLENAVLLPILGDQYGRILERQELKLAYADGTFTIQYWETTLPLAPRTYLLILQQVLERLSDVLALKMSMCSSFRAS